jgi:hypothetical protein
VTGSFVGEPVFSAANGDRLFGTHTGQVASTPNPNVVTYTEVLTISGGTGHFSGVAGDLQAEGVGNLATGDYRQSLLGPMSDLGHARSFETRRKKR